MHLFRYARDYYGAQEAQQVLLAAALLSIIAVSFFVALHLLRRSAGQPVSSADGEHVAPATEVHKYEFGARLYHWGNLIFLLGLVVSGLALFVPGELRAAPWLRLHEIFAALYIAGLLLHIVVAPLRGTARTMWFDRHDWSDLRLIIANFFGRTRAYPRFGKYDPWQKLYHALLAVLSAAVIFSGIYLVLSAEVWRTFSHDWMRQMRLLHDVAAIAFVAVILGHIYFGVIRINWPQLGAMITGRLSAAAFNRYHDARRWPSNSKFKIQNSKLDV
jgi:Ni/Fe-hydrogenase 1 B-type cytochrome subunit